LKSTAADPSRGLDGRGGGETKEILSPMFWKWN